MACHTPPLKKVKKQGQMPLPSLGPQVLGILITMSRKEARWW